MKNFLKGIVAGIGGVAPGLNGSVLLIIFGLYRKILEALATIFTKFKKNIKFLFPIGMGMLIGVILFSNVIEYLLINYEMQTRYCFLGLILGTIPLLLKETKKNGFSKKYNFVILISFIIGTFLFTLNPNTNGQITNPTILNSIILGFLVATTAIVPGVEPTVLLSTLGYYELYVNSLANIRLEVLIPMIIGLAIGGIVISYIITKLFKYYYTMTYSIIFGSFLSMIPNILNETCKLGLNNETYISLILIVIGFIVSYYLGTIRKKRKAKKRSNKK